MIKKSRSSFDKLGTNGIFLGQTALFKLKDPVVGTAYKGLAASRACLVSVRRLGLRKNPVEKIQDVICDLSGFFFNREMPRVNQM